MMQASSRTAQRAAELRLDFDRSFADPLSVAGAAIQHFLAIRLDAQHFALRLADISGLFAEKKVTPIPGADEYLLGIAGFRGVVTPVYDLKRVLGRRSAAVPRWLVVAAAARVALAFDGFEGQLRIAPAAIATAQSTDDRAFTNGVLQIGHLLRPIIDLSRVLKALHT
jgi:chemotaxis signal transduction protein